MKNQHKAAQETAATSTVGVGKATYVHVQKPKGEEAAKLTTMQKLQMLRNLKSKPKPVHSMMLEAAVRLPRDHFQNIREMQESIQTR